MKTISNALATHLAGDVTTTCYLWLVTLQNSTVLGFTDHDADITFNSVVYKAATGFTSSAVETTAALNVDNLEVQGFLVSPSITEADLDAGVWDFAKVQVMLVNWADLSMGALNIRLGHIGNVTLNRLNYVAELRGLAQAYTRQIGELYQPSCRNDVGDSRCTQNMTNYTATGSVSTVTSTRDFTTNLGSSTVHLTPSTTGAPTDDYFSDGKLTWTSGQNNGLSMDVKDYLVSGAEVILKLGMSYPITIGDTFSIKSGCNKIGRAGDCKIKFGNYVNFNGEEDLPGLDKIMRVGGR